jgi:hypothetical protein
VICRCSPFAMPDNAGFNRQLNRQQPALRLLRTRGVGTGLLSYLRSSRCSHIWEGPAMIRRTIAAKLDAPAENLDEMGAPSANDSSQPPISDWLVDRDSNPRPGIVRSSGSEVILLLTLRMRNGAVSQSAKRSNNGCHGECQSEAQQKFITSSARSCGVLWSQTAARPHSRFSRLG